MDNNINLSANMQSRLPAPLQAFMKTAGDIAFSEGTRLYLVGGLVRDLLLEKTNIDLDLVVEGSAIDLVGKLADTVEGRTVKHSRFNTATVAWDNWKVDFATARSETYTRPGALPTVKPGSIREDLFRRDFTVNAMAVSLIPGRYGELIDMYGGVADLGQKAIRVLHNKSFIDDATRIWRAIRYEQRFGFNIEPVTLNLLRRDVEKLDTISGDRIRHEMELALKEDFPEKVLSRADELGVLDRLHPALRADEWLAEKYNQVRHENTSEKPAAGSYLALLVYRLDSRALEKLISRLRFSKSISQTLRDTITLKKNIACLTDPALTPGGLYRMLRGYSLQAVRANLLATTSDEAQRRILFYLGKLSRVRPGLTGADLLRMGVPSGPRMREVLERLLDARLDGKAVSREYEEDIVKEYLDG